MDTQSKLKPVTYVVGDVNGVGRLLASLLLAVSKDAEMSFGVPRIVFLGNLSDMGRETRLVIEQVTQTVGSMRN